MTHGGKFDPSDSTIHGGAEQDDDRFTTVKTAKDRADRLSEPIRDQVGELWPATVRLRAQSNATGGEIWISGEGWKVGSEVTFYADGVAGDAVPRRLDSAIAEAGRGSVAGYYELKYSKPLPRSQWTPVTLRAEGGGETATARIPDYIFYV